MAKIWCNSARFKPHFIERVLLPDNNLQCKVIERLSFCQCTSNRKEIYGNQDLHFVFRQNFIASIVLETNRSLPTGRTHPRVVASWTHPSSWWTLYWVSQPPIFLENWFGISTTWVTRTMLPQAAELSLLLLYYVSPTSHEINCKTPVHSAD